MFSFREWLCGFMEHRWKHTVLKRGLLIPADTTQCLRCFIKKNGNNFTIPAGSEQALLMSGAPVRLWD